jgi:hypothetical protein
MYLLVQILRDYSGGFVELKARQFQKGDLTFRPQVSINMMYSHHSKNIPFEEQQQSSDDEVYCFPARKISPSVSPSPSNEVLYTISSSSVETENESGRGQPPPEEEERSQQTIIRGSNGFDFVRQPCKARGVEIKLGQNPHVAKFAYIDIPVGTENGTILSCSHPVCSSLGRRFRYCTHCKTAVAKRNFNIRHAHPEVKAKSRTTTRSTTPRTTSSSVTMVTTNYSYAVSSYSTGSTATSIVGGHQRCFEASPEVPSMRDAFSSADAQGTLHHFGTPSSAFLGLILHLQRTCLSVCQSLTFSTCCSALVPAMIILKRWSTGRPLLLL